MYLRLVRTVIAPGMADAYWKWSREILDLWDEHGVLRAGGPYATTGPGGEGVAVWLSLHDSEEQMREQFRVMYSEGRGRELIGRRPALVSATTEGWYPEWDTDGPALLPPAW